MPGLIPASVRKTSLRHNLRTEAAIRFEKGVDISNTVHVLKRAALLIKEICGGKISSEIIDVYPDAKTTNRGNFTRSLPGKNKRQTLSAETVKNILKSLNFSIVKEDGGELTVAVPFSNPDITMPADIIEEIMRIDGLDNIEIPSAITIAPATETGAYESAIKEKIAAGLRVMAFRKFLQIQSPIANTFPKAHLRQR